MKGGTVEKKTGSSSTSAAEAAHHASFVLRCWTDAAGGVRVRLIEVHSGVSYPLARLVDLPDLVRRLLVRSPVLPDQAPDGDAIRRANGG
jgi:hypothetical protein